MRAAKITSVFCYLWGGVSALAYTAQYYELNGFVPTEMSLGK